MKKNVWKKGVVVLMAAMTAVMLTACGGAKDDGGSAEDKKDENGLKTVSIASPGQHNLPTENALLAKELGYVDEEMEKAGYKVEYKGFAQAGPAINEALAAKEVDIAVYNELPALTAKSNGIDLKIVAISTSEYNYALFAGKDSGIESVKDLEGKKVIVTPGTILYKYFIDLCDENGVDSSKVEQINALADANSVITSGEADAYVCAYESAIMLENKGIGKMIANTTTNLDESTGIGVTCRVDYLEKEPEAVKAYIRALKRASEYAAENTEDVYAKLVTESNTEDVLRKKYEYDTSFSFFTPSFSDEYLKRVQAQYDFALEHDMLADEFSLDDLLDSTYVDEVMAE